MFSYVRAAGARAGGGVGVRVVPVVETRGAGIGGRVRIGVGQGGLGVGRVEVREGGARGGLVVVRRVWGEVVVLHCSYEEWVAE